MAVSRHKHSLESWSSSSRKYYYDKTSENLESYHYNMTSPWDLKESLDDHIEFSPGLMPPLLHKQSHTNYNHIAINQAYLALTMPPDNIFRYRYDTEMSGTHGSLQGKGNGKEKSVPSVQLLNFPYEALIRVTLVTCREKDEHYPHPHSLFVKEKLYQKKIYTNWDGKHLTKTGHYCDPHYIKVGMGRNDYTARFEGMCIINSKKENFHSSVREKLQMRFLEQNHEFSADDSFRLGESEELARKVEAAVDAVDVDFVSLCFEAFREENGKLFPVCQPLYSNPIGNAKSAKTGKLKISRINKCSGSCKGGDEIWLLVEKINKKGLIVRFSEECNGKIIWESCIEGNDLILHHQYAVIFKTPAYKDVNISSEVEVEMRLERATQPNQPCDYSKPITFVYEPLKSKSSKGDSFCKKESFLAPFKQIHTKRPRPESSGPAFSCQNKRRTDVIECETMAFEDCEGDYEQLLYDDKNSYELHQALEKFNVEEFLKFLSSEEVDVPVQRDGIACSSKFRRDFLYKLYLLYSKLGENDIKKLTKQISNFRVSKKEVVESKSGVEKDQVQDAASTLLSLRSKAMTLNLNDVSLEKPKTLRDFLLPLKSLNQIFDSCGEPGIEGGQSPVQASGIMFDMSTETKEKRIWESKNQGGETRERKALELCALEEIKKEADEAEDLMNAEGLENICSILNENGSWKKLADLLSCSSVVPSAEESVNPTKCIFDYVEEMKGAVKMEALRNVLNTINERKALKVLDEIIVKKFF